MNAFIENIFDSMFGGLRYKLLRQLWRIINGIRRFFVLVIFLYFSLMMMTLGLFGSITYALFQYSSKGEIQFDAPLIFMSSDFIFFFIFLVVLLGKSTWLKASGLAKHFETL